MVSFYCPIKQGTEDPAKCRATIDQSLDALRPGREGFFTPHLSVCGVACLARMCPRMHTRSGEPSAVVVRTALTYVPPKPHHYRRVGLRYAASRHIEDHLKSLHHAAVKGLPLPVETRSESTESWIENYVELFS